MRARVLRFSRDLFAMFVRFRYLPRGMLVFFEDPRPRVDLASPVVGVVVAHTSEKAVLSEMIALGSSREA